MRKLISLLWFAFSCHVGYAGAHTILSKLNLDAATRQILKATNVRVLGANTEIINGREVHIIKVLTPDGHIRYYKIDAETGASVS